MLSIFLNASASARHASYVFGNHTERRRVEAALRSKAAAMPILATDASLYCANVDRPVAQTVTILSSRTAALMSAKCLEYNAKVLVKFRRRVYLFPQECDQSVYVREESCVGRRNVVNAVVCGEQPAGRRGLLCAAGRQRRYNCLGVIRGPRSKTNFTEAV